MILAMEVIQSKLTLAGQQLYPNAVVKPKQSITVLSITAVKLN